MFVSSLNLINFLYYWKGVRGLFRGVTPRGIQAIWQTVFMVALPNILGV